MNNVLIGFLGASALAIWLLGWPALLLILLFSLFACCRAQKKSGPVLSFFEKLGLK